MCKEILERLALTGRRYVTDLIVLTFVLTTIMERLPVLNQLGILFFVMVALSQFGVALSRGTVSHLDDEPGRRQALVLGILVLVVHFTGGAIEGLQGLPRGETLVWSSSASSTYSMGALASLQWVLPFLYALALLRWMWPEIFSVVRLRGRRLGGRGSAKKDK